MKKLLFALLLISTAASAQTTQKANCTATTKAGTPCSRKAKPGTLFCFQHNPAAFHCGAMTKAGTLCTRTVKVMGHRCKTHS